MLPAEHTEREHHDAFGVAKRAKGGHKSVLGKDGCRPASSAVGVEQAAVILSCADH
jgi:hypothetical protein